jgi:hypothetical protein
MLQAKRLVELLGNPNIGEFLASATSICGINSAEVAAAMNFCLDSSTA